MDGLVTTISTELGGVSDAVVYGLFVLVVTQLTLQVWALVDLARVDRVVGGRKWVWAALIVLAGNAGLGAILYFAIGRRVPALSAEADTPVVTDGDKTARAVDALYGDQNGGASR